MSDRSKTKGRPMDKPNRLGSRPSGGCRSGRTVLSDPEFQTLLNRLDLSWEGYRKVRKGVKKRLRRRVIELGFRRFGDYLAAIEADAELAAECRLIMTISISRFFRDADLWRLVEEDILPTFGDRETIAAWSAGCARGEEVYTLKIIHDRWVRRSALAPELAPELAIVATDLNTAYLAAAEAGEYTAGSFREMADDVWQARFEKVPRKKSYRIDPALKGGIIWREHDLLSGVPPGGYDLVFLRNSVLTYGRSVQKRAALKTAVAGLNRGGFLIIGAKEALPSGEWGLKPALGRNDIWAAG